MVIEELMAELEIESPADFRYFEQFSALMETASEDLDYDLFLEIFLVPKSERLTEMTNSFFEDLILGVPDDNTELYAALHRVQETLVTLAGYAGARSRSFYTDELFAFRQWLLSEGLVTCTPEGGGNPQRLSPLEALALFREEKLTGTRYQYDFFTAMPPEPDDYLLDRMEELREDSVCNSSADSYDYDYNGDCDAADSGDADDMNELPVELPADWEPTEENLEALAASRRVIDPYTDGFVHRYHPVIEGEGISREDEEPFPEF